MSFFGRVKNLFRSSASEETRWQLPSIIEVNVNPKDFWEIVGDLGDGAFGKVEKAVSKADQSLFAAAKAIEVQEGEELKDFLVEIDILTSCKHANIVNLYACYFFENKLHMLLEFCGGGAVDAIMIELEKPLTEKQIAYVARYTCEAVAFLHDNNVIHRDLKAGNILLTSDGVVKLADFGVSAKLKDRNEKRDTFIGTPYWMAPEVMMCETFKDQPYGTRSDIWSLGITLIEMAQMEPPHANVSPMRVLIKVQKSAPPTLDNPSSWSVFFADFLSQCLVKNPAERKTAKQILSHPFIANATDPHPVLALLAEVNADIEEELVVDEDHASCGESCADSEDHSPVEALWATSIQIPSLAKNVAAPTSNISTEKRSIPSPPLIAQLSSTVPTTHAALLMSMPELAISKWSHPHVQSGKPLKTFIRSNSLKSKFVSPKPSLPSSLSLPGVQKWKTEPPLHFSAPASDKEVPRDRNVCSSYKPFPAEQNARPTYFSPPSPAEKKAPPEPPVDYHDHLNSEENAPPAANASKGTFPFASQNVQDGVKLSTPEELCKTTFAVRKHPHRQTVTKKTRTYTVNGMQVTSTTMHVLGAKEDMQLRKQQLQDLRRLQREEARQRQELQVEGVSSVEQQERKFQQERAVMSEDVARGGILSTFTALPADKAP
ncbi:hypothetical protein V3C99_018151 [Haemonchus contortus]